MSFGLLPFGLLRLMLMCFTLLGPPSQRRR